MTVFTLPTSRRITQEWGQDFNWLNGKHYPDGFYATIGWLGHNGIDYGCPEGDDVEAVCDGVIEYVGPANNHPLLTGGGNALLLRNDELGIRFEYLHLSQQNVYTGQRVKRGQVIARSGNTGISSGAHLHLGAIPIRPNLNNGYRGRVDPTGWLYGPSNPDYAGIAAQGTTTTEPTPQEEPLVPNESDKVFYHLDGGEKVSLNEFLNDLVREARSARAATQALLSVQLPDPSEPGKTYSLADYIVWGATNAKNAAGAAGVAAGNTSPEALAKAVSEAQTGATAQAIADQLTISVKQ